MTASNTDKFKKLTNNFSTTLSSAIVGSGDTSMSLASTTNLPTDTGAVFVIDRVNSSGTATPSTREYVIGTVSGSNITNLIRGTGNSTAQAHSTGAVVEQVVDQKTINDIIDGILQDHDQQGRHKQLTDTNGNVILALSATGSAVNYLQIANAATGNGVQVQAVGTDPNIDVTAVPKGTGGWKVKGRHDGWSDLSGFGTFTYNANNGNKEFVVTTPSDLSSFLYAGMKVRFDRNTAPPTQAMAFAAASSQYATKASPTGISFTAAFTLEAWIYPQSYATMGIISRWNATNGFLLYLNSSGQIACQIDTATSCLSYQSVALNRWQHIAVTFSSGTWNTYLNGVLIPKTTSGSGTSFTQAGSLQIGAYNSTNFFNGYISEARVWSAAQTQANIQANMAISLTGSETNLVALFQGNGNFNDKTSNANALTATNGAIATQAANPYNSTEYGIITKVTSTQLTIFCGTDYTIPNGTLSNPFYSTSRAPAGFPISRGKWVVDTLIGSQSTQSSPTANTWYNLANFQLSIPTGEWTFSRKTSFRATCASAATTNFAVVYSTVSTTNSAESDARTTLYSYSNNVTEIGTVHSAPSLPLTVVSQTVYYQNIKTDSATTTSIVMTANGNAILMAECAYV